MNGLILLAGSGAGPLLRLDEPLSFWGGVDPASGQIIQVRHPQCGRLIAGTVLALPATIGSSSSSAVMLELIRVGKAPAALVLVEPDAILLLGIVVAQEMGWRTPPAIRLEREAFAALLPDQYLVDETGLSLRIT